jgi:hypothetical protein
MYKVIVNRCRQSQSRQQNGTLLLRNRPFQWNKLLAELPLGSLILVLPSQILLDFAGHSVAFGATDDHLAASTKSDARTIS